MFVANVQKPEHAGMRMTDDRIDQLIEDVADIKERLSALENAPAARSETEPSVETPAHKGESRVPAPIPILMIIFGGLLTLTVVGAIIGIPLIIGGIVMLSKAGTPGKEPAEPHAQTEQETAKRTPGRAEEPSEAKREQPAARRPELDSNLVLRTLTVVGIVALVLGAVFFLTLSIQNEWLTKPVQLLIGVIAGIGIAVFGSRVRLHEAYAFWGDLVTTAGTMIVYFTVYAAYALEPYRAAIGLSSAILGIALMVIAGVHLTYAVTLGNRRITIGAILLGALTFLFAEPSIISLLYVAILGIGTRVAASIRSWHHVSALSFGLAAIGIASVGWSTDAGAGLVTLALLMVVSEWLAYQRSEHAYELGLGPLIFGGLLCLPLASHLGWHLGYVSLTIAGAAIGLATLHGSTARVSRALSATLFIVLGSGLLVSPEYLGLVWAALALVLITGAQRFDSFELRIAGHAVAAIGLIVVLIENLPLLMRASWPAALTLPAFYLAIATTAAYAIVSRAEQGIVSRVYSALATTLIVLIALASSSSSLAFISVVLVLAIIYRMIIPDAFFHVQSIVLSGIAIAATIIHDATSTSTPWTYAVTIAALVALNTYTRRQDLEDGGSWIVTTGVAAIGVLIARLVMIIAEYATIAEDPIITLGWLGAGIAGLVLGITASDRTIRLAGLGLITLAVFKAFFVDVFELDLVWRVIAFVVLGVALLSAALLYGRFRERIGELF